MNQDKSGLESAVSTTDLSIKQRKQGEFYLARPIKQVDLLDQEDKTGEFQGIQLGLLD